MDWDNLVVFKPRSPVCVGFGKEKISAEVLSVSIGTHNVQYQCAWWDGRTRKVEWLEHFEVEPLGDKSQSVPIGFSSPAILAGPQRIYGDN